MSLLQTARVTRMPRRAAVPLPAVNSPVLLEYSEQLAILLFGQLMKWLRPLVRRGDSIPLADLKDALWAVKEAWELHRDIARASGAQQLGAQRALPRCPPRRPAD